VLEKHIIKMTDTKIAYESIFSSIWNKAVPSNGEASTSYGEAIRCVGRTEYEIVNNGAENWCDEAGEDNYYDQMLSYLQGFAYDLEGENAKKLEDASDSVQCDICDCKDILERVRQFDEEDDDAGEQETYDNEEMINEILEETVKQFFIMKKCLVDHLQYLTVRELKKIVAPKKFARKQEYIDYILSEN